MKLFYSSTSPFARKVRMTAFELGMEKSLELVTVDVYADNSYVAVNPLAKIPTLETKEGLKLTNSPYICEYLNTISLARKVLPAGGPERWEVLNIQSLCDGIMEAAVLRRYESQRSADKFDKNFDARQYAKITQTLEFLESHASLFDQDWDMKEISLMCALGYLELRFAHEKTLEKFPRLEAWYKNNSSRASVAETKAKL